MAVRAQEKRVVFNPPNGFRGVSRRLRRDDLGCTSLSRLIQLLGPIWLEGRKNKVGGGSDGC